MCQPAEEHSWQKAARSACDPALGDLRMLEGRQEDTEGVEPGFEED